MKLPEQIGLWQEKRPSSYSMEMLNRTRWVAVNPQCSRIGWEGGAGLLRGDSAKSMSIETKDHS